MDTATSTDRATDPGHQETAGATDRAKEAAGAAAGHAEEKIADAASQAKQQAASAHAQAKSRLRTEVDQRSSELGARAGSTADDLRSIGDQLREQGKDQPAKLADQAADQVGRAARYLEDGDADRLLHDLEDFGRQRPWAVIAGGLTIGFVASRFLKASSADRYHGARETPKPRTEPTRPVRPAASPTASPLDDLAADATRTAASAPQPDAGAGTGMPGTGTLADRGAATPPLGGALSPDATPPASGALPTDGPLTTGADPMSTVHRDRENGVGSDGDV